VWCGTAAESTEHLFLYCDFARQIWVEVFNWLRLNFFLPHSILSILNLLQGTHGKKLKKQCWGGVGDVEDAKFGYFLQRCCSI
jgi:hypothetical protein